MARKPLDSKLVDFYSPTHGYIQEKKFFPNHYFLNLNKIKQEIFIKEIISLFKKY